MATSTATLPPRAATLRRSAQITAGVMFAAMLLVPVAVAVHAGMYDSFVDNALSGWGMWGTFAIHMWTRPSRKECATTVGLGLLLRAVYNAAIGERGYPGSALIAMGTFLGLASLAVLAARSLQGGERRGVSRQSLGVIALLSYIGICLGFYLALAKMALPRKYDYYLYAFDSSLGFLPSFAAGELAGACAPLDWTLLMVYNSLGFWFSLLYALHANARVKYPLSILKILVANAIIGFSLYFLFPAMGPKYAFPSFPDAPAVVRPMPALLSGVPNAMPSLHFGGTLLIFWLLKPWKWLYRAAGGFCALTALATLGLGEHYLVDLVVAVPYALAILAFGSTVRERCRALAASVSMLAAWLWILRGGHFTALISWGLIVLTLSAAATWQRRLGSALFPERAEVKAPLSVALQ